MSIEQPKVIDIISVSPEGVVMLHISDHLPWDNEHFFLLQNKLNDYLAFIESGQIYDTHPMAAETTICIHIRMVYEPNAKALSFLERCSEIINNAGFKLEWSIAT